MLPATKPTNTLPLPTGTTQKQRRTQCARLRLSMCLLCCLTSAMTRTDSNRSSSPIAAPPAAIFQVGNALSLARACADLPLLPTAGDVVRHSSRCRSSLFQARRAVQTRSNEARCAETNRGPADGIVVDATRAAFRDGSLNREPQTCVQLLLLLLLLLLSEAFATAPVVGFRARCSSLSSHRAR